MQFIVHHHTHHHNHDPQPLASSPIACCLMLRSLQQCRNILKWLQQRWPAATPGHATIYSIVTTTQRWPAATAGHVTIYSIATTTHKCHYCLSLPPRLNHSLPVASGHLPGCGRFSMKPRRRVPSSPGFRNRHNHMHRLSSSANEADSVLMQPEPTPWMYRLSSRRNRHPAESETW